MCDQVLFCKKDLTASQQIQRPFNDRELRFYFQSLVATSMLDDTKLKLNLYFSSEIRNCLDLLRMPMA